MLWLCRDAPARQHVQSFFKRDLVPLEEAPDGGQRKLLAGLYRKLDLVFLQRCVRLCTHAAEQNVGVRFDPLGAAITAHGVR